MAIAFKSMFVMNADIQYILTIPLACRLEPSLGNHLLYCSCYLSTMKRKFESIDASNVALIRKHNMDLRLQDLHLWNKQVIAKDLGSKRSEGRDRVVGSEKPEEPRTQRELEAKRA